VSRTLYGIGAGPGDPELITLLGLRRLRDADCVFVPATRPLASYAGRIVAGYLEPERQRVIELVCPAYRDRAAIEARWIELAQVVLDSIADGRTGAFVCEGDPSLYSTFTYLRRGLQRLNADIDVTTIPGVDSVTASAALAEIPLATWDERLLITPAVRKDESLEALLSQAETVALLKATGSPAALAEAIERLGTGVAATLVRRAGRPEQQVLRDLDAIRSAERDYFTTILLRRSEP
jgi:precorrin-2/cobalt-factor-2 C20-methyltransferase